MELLIIIMLDFWNVWLMLGVLVITQLKIDAYNCGQYEGSCSNWEAAALYSNDDHRWWSPLSKTVSIHSSWFDLGNTEVWFVKERFWPWRNGVDGGFVLKPPIFVFSLVNLQCSYYKSLLYYQFSLLCHYFCKCENSAVVYRLCTDLTQHESAWLYIFDSYWL